jgi:hypothetical protein
MNATNATLTLSREINLEGTDFDEIAAAIRQQFGSDLQRLTIDLSTPSSASDPLFTIVVADTPSARIHAEALGFEPDAD